MIEAAGNRSGRGAGAIASALVYTKDMNAEGFERRAALASRPAPRS
jgi:hypothetical protein